MTETRSHTQQGREFIRRGDGHIIVVTEATRNPIDAFPDDGRLLQDIAGEWLAEWGGAESLGRRSGGWDA